MKTRDIRIQGKGVTPRLPDVVTYFQEASLMEDVMIPAQKPKIEDIIDLIISTDIVDYKLVNTERASSYEGQHLTGQKIVITIRFNLQIKYAAQNCAQTVHVAHSKDLIQSTFLVVPDMLDGERVCDLIRKGKYTLNCYVEDAYGIQVGDDVIRTYITYLVDLKIN